MMALRPTDIAEPQRSILVRIGVALLVVQGTELLIKQCLKHVIQIDGPLTLQSLYGSDKKRTLGQLLSALRKHVSVEQNFDSALEEFLRSRNSFVHDLDGIPGWSLETEEGLIIAKNFLDRLIATARIVMSAFLALMRAWQTEAGLELPPNEYEPRLFPDSSDDYKNLAGYIFRGK